MTDASEIATPREVRNSYLTTKLPASTLVQVASLARPELNRRSEGAKSQRVLVVQMSSRMSTGKYHCEVA
jgi:hypothetical protein